MDKITQTQKLAESYALNFKDCGGGHVQISNHCVLVNYWPESAKRTAYINGGKSHKHCSPWDAVRLCLLSGKPGLAPKKKRITKNAPQVDLKDTKTNPAGIKNLYDGDRPPWEYKDFIMCESDNLRIKAYQLVCQAEQMDIPVEDTVEGSTR